MKIDRLLAILTILLQRENITAPELAGLLEVNRRTISRDIEDLCKAGFPIITKQGAGGGISLPDGFKLDKSLLTEDELQNILIGLKGLESIDKSKKVGRLLNKLTPAPVNQASPNGFVIDLASFYKESLSEKIALLRSAIGSFNRVAFTYYYGKGCVEREIEPYLIMFKWSDWYIFGYCIERLDFRMFKLNRLWSLRITDTAFVPQAIPPEKQEIGSHIADENPMIVLFSESAEYLLVEMYGPSCFVKLPDGRLKFERGYSDREHVLRWILSFGPAAEVLYPEELRNEAARLAKEMFMLYM